MKKKDYYLILGVPRSVSAEEIKAAFRKLAKKCHPDKTGPEGTRAFQDLAEAYGVLSDADARAKYTESLRRSEERGRGNIGRGPAQGGSFDEAGPDMDSGADFTEDIFSELRKSPRFSSLDDIFLEILQGSSFSRRARRRESFDLELILSPDEARRGGAISAQIPLPHACPACAGAGGTGFFPCGGCGGTGSVAGTANISISVPPGVEDGTVLSATVHLPGSRFLINFRIRVDEGAA